MAQLSVENQGIHENMKAAAITGTQFHWMKLL